MRVIGNLIWLVLSGFWLAIGYVLAGVLACILVITIPFGLQSFKLTVCALWPFGREVVDTSAVRAAYASSIAVPQAGG